MAGMGSEAMCLSIKHTWIIGIGEISRRINGGLKRYFTFFHHWIQWSIYKKFWSRKIEIGLEFIFLSQGLNISLNSESVSNILQNISTCQLDSSRSFGPLGQPLLLKALDTLGWAEMQECMGSLPFWSLIGTPLMKSLPSWLWRHLVMCS